MPNFWRKNAEKCISFTKISVLQHTKSLKDAANDIDLAHWNLFPAINGTLTFQHENKDAMLSIGEDDFSFVFVSEGRIVKAIDNASFSIAEILELIKMVNKD